MESDRIYEDIQAQGDNLRRMIGHFYGAEKQRLKQAAQFLCNEKPIVFIGMGSATYLNYPAKFYLGRYGRYADVINASDALYSVLPSLKDVNVVINSRSGETVEVVKLGQALVRERIPFLALTNAPESRLAGLATHVLWSNSRADDLVSINIVTGMMTATLILAAEVLGHLESSGPLLEMLPFALNESVKKAWERADELADIFGTSRPIYLLYRDASEGMGHCGRLVLEEVARWPSVAMEAGEFRQGAIEVMDDRFAAVLSIPEGELGQLNLALAKNILACGGRVLLLGEGGDEGPNCKIIHVAPVPLHFRPVLEIPPLQVLACKLAERQGYSAGTVRYLSKVITSELGIPKLNTDPER
jgi:glucosamine--fructose-6-phosphate aminotransferase (isomerizing)